MFREKLETAIMGITGGQAAIVMGFDGIPVDTFSLDSETDMETIGMEFSVLLKEVKKAAEMLEAGAAEELTVRTEKMSTILRIIDEEYFVAIAIAADGNLGKARYVLRVMAPELGKELS